MAGRLGIDFGTCNTVLAVWDSATSQARTLDLPELTRLFAFQGEDVPVVPSLISYQPGGATWIGAQVLDRGLDESETTFRWMKRYISARSPRRRRVGEREIGDAEAGRDFLVTLLRLALAETGSPDEEVVYTLPVEAYEHYEDWVARVSDEVGITRYRMIDEASAAALGYGVHIQPGDAYLVFDFGGGTLQASVVLVEEAADADASSGGQRCRVLGKAGAEVGGSTIDGWLFEHVLRESGRLPEDPVVRRLGRRLLAACEGAKMVLSSAEETDVSATDDETGTTLSLHLTRRDFEALLDEHEALLTVHQTLQRALGASAERGYAEDDIKAVLSVGGSGLIPAVHRALEQHFGRERVQVRRPMDAVARGAAAFAAGVSFYDFIQHEYALRHTDMETGEYLYRTLLKAGTPYPTEKPLATVTIKATYDGQTQFGLDIFELGYRRDGGSAGGSGGGPVELVFDPQGAVQLTQVGNRDAGDRTRFWINEQTPTFLTSTRGAAQGEPCFRVEFGVDDNKRLTVTVNDLLTGEVPLSRHPVVRLT